VFNKIVSIHLNLDFFPTVVSI